MRIPFLLSICAALVVAAPADDAQPQSRAVRPLEGASFAGRVTDITPTWQITFAAEQESRTLPIDKLLIYGAHRDSDAGPQLLLADGGLLRADVLELTSESLVIESRLWLESRLPLGAVRAVVFRPPAEPLRRDLLYARIRETRGGQDQLLLANGDLVTGQLVADESGRIWSLDRPPAIVLKAGGRELQVPAESVVAIVFNPALVDRSRPRQPHAKVGFVDGSLLVVEQLDAGDLSLRVRLPGGIDLTLEPPLGDESVWSSMGMIQPLGSSAVYLSDMRPASYKHIPLLDFEWPYREDRNVLGGHLRVDGHLYPKGIGMHSTSRLAYALGGQFQRFEAELGIDDAASHHGSVVFRVFVNDAAGQWQRAYESPVVRAGQPPRSASVDVSGARGLALIVDPADRGDVGDHANWLNARLIPR